MVNEEEIMNGTRPDEVWEALDAETRERVTNMFLRLAFDFVIYQKTTIDNDGDASNTIQQRIPSK